MRRRGERGHAMLELAMCSAVLVSCLGGTFQFGYTFYVYNQLVTAVGNGGRYAAMRTYRAATAGDVEKAKRAIRNMVAYGDPQASGGSEPIVAGLTPEQVEVKWVSDPSGAPTAVDVSVVNFSLNAVFKTITFSGRPGVEFPFVGRYAPSEREP
jgi:Flp pilus assembly protein TadG